ncbi:MAG: DUF58 domain-containing protein [Kiritimatiellia bacterium]
MDTLELMQKVRSIRILTRRLVDERLSGDYHTSFKGKGIEFDEIREYQIGDDVRSIDWNVTARTGIPQIKRFTEERQLTVQFLIDVSGSLNFGSISRTKADLAAEIAALLAFTSIHNQDNVGLILFSDRIVKEIPPQRGRNAVSRIVREILSSAENATGKTNIAEALHRLEIVQHRRSVVFLISDFQDDGYDTALARIARKHDVICCPVSDPAEHNLPNTGMLELADPETGETRWVDLSSPKLRTIFAEQARQAERNLQELFLRSHVSTMRFSTDADPIDVIRSFFRRRANRRLRHRA